MENLEIVEKSNEAIKHDKSQLICRSVGELAKKNVCVYVQVSRLISAAGTNIIKNIYVEGKND